MENNIKLSQKAEQEILSLALKDYFRAPIFTTTEQDNIRTIRVGENVWTIGIRNPYKPNMPFVRGLTMEHALIIFGIFSFTNSLECLRKIPFSFNKLCQRLYGNSSPRTYTKAKDLIGDILNCWTRITYSDGRARTFRVLKNADKWSLYGSNPNIGSISKPSLTTGRENTTARNSCFLKWFNINFHFFRNHRIIALQEGCVAFWL